MLSKKSSRYCTMPITKSSNSTQTTSSNTPHRVGQFRRRLDPARSRAASNSTRTAPLSEGRIITAKAIILRGNPLVLPHPKGLSMAFGRKRKANSTTKTAKRTSMRTRKNMRKMKRRKRRRRKMVRRSQRRRSLRISVRRDEHLLYRLLGVGSLFRTAQNRTGETISSILGIVSPSLVSSTRYFRR